MPPGTLGLKEHEYEIDTHLITQRTIGYDNVCTSIGHSHIVWSPVDSRYHACWTRKEGGAAGDEVYCSSRAPTEPVWSAPEAISNGAPNDQDHATLAIKPFGQSTRRVAYHDATSSFGNDAHEAVVAMYRPGGSRADYRVPDGTASPQPGWQDRPFVAVDGDGKMHVVWEDGPFGNEVVKYVRCVHSTPSGCDEDREWEFNNVAISEPGIDWAQSPHMAIRFDRIWISYEQRLIGGAVNRDVVVRHRCTDAPFTRAWTLSDPYPPTTGMN